MRKKRTRGTSTTAAQVKESALPQTEVINSSIEEKEIIRAKEPKTENEETIKKAELPKTKIENIKFEIFETNVTLKDVEKAVKKDAADRNLRGKIDIYLNAEKRAAYYTVDGIGSEEYKVDLNNI